MTSFTACSFLFQNRHLPIEIGWIVKFHFVIMLGETCPSTAANQAALYLNIIQASLFTSLKTICPPSAPTCGENIGSFEEMLSTTPCVQVPSGSSCSLATAHTLDASACE